MSTRYCKACEAEAARARYQAERKAQGKIVRTEAVRRAEFAQIQAMLERRMTWAQIGARLGITRDASRQRYAESRRAFALDDRLESTPPPPIKCRKCQEAPADRRGLCIPCYGKAYRRGLVDKWGTSSRRYWGRRYRRAHEQGESR